MDDKELSKVIDDLPKLKEELEQMIADPTKADVDRVLEILDKVMGDFENIKSIEQDEN
jgi:hypothetical protein